MVPQFCPLSGVGQRFFVFYDGNGGKYLAEQRRGTLYVFLAAVLYSIGGLCIKLIPWNGMAINGGRTAIALVVIGGYLWIRRQPLKLNRWVAVGALSVFGCNELFSIANKMTTAANAIVITTLSLSMGTTLEASPI